MDNFEDKLMSLSVQELSLTVSLSAVESLYTLALFHPHEPGFLNIFPSLSNVQSYLKAK